MILSISRRRFFQILAGFFILFCLVALPLQTVFAATNEHKNTVALLKDVSKKYRASKLIKIEVEKKVTSDLMGKTTTYDGHIYLSQGKFRWENDTPDETLLLFDGQTIWNVQYPPKDLGGAPQVAKAKLDKNTKSQILISTLIGKEPIDKNFEIIDTQKDGDLNIVKLKPLSSDVRVKDLILNVDGKTKQIREISYKDDVNNLTVIQMKKTDFNYKDKNDLFKFKVPKDAQVTNL